MEAITFKITPERKARLDQLTKRTGAGLAEILRAGVNTVLNVLESLPADEAAALVALSEQNMLSDQVAFQAQVKIEIAKRGIKRELSDVEKLMTTTGTVISTGTVIESVVKK